MSDLKANDVESENKKLSWYTHALEVHERDVTARLDTALTENEV